MPTSQLPKDRYIHTMKFTVKNTILAEKVYAKSMQKSKAELKADLQDKCFQYFADLDSTRFKNSKRYTKKRSKCIRVINDIYSLYDINFHSSIYDEVKPLYIQNTASDIFDITDFWFVDNSANLKFPLIKLESLFTGSVKQLQYQLAICNGLIQSTIFRVLRNARIHTLSIFFGLCCSSSGYIFNAISGVSSHPIPA